MKDLKAKTARLNKKEKSLKLYAHWYLGSELGELVILY